MHSSSLSFSSPESGPSSHRLILTSSSSTTSPTSLADSSYFSDPEQEHEQGSDSPTESETSNDAMDFSPESKSIKLPSSAKHTHAPPSGTSEIKPLASRYPKIFTNPPPPPSSFSSRPNRIRGLSPLTPSTSNSTSLNMNPEFKPRLPKSQPLSRALFNRSLSDPAPSPSLQAGIFGGVGKKKTSQKVIVPSKSFRTTFELGLSASELARRA
ncbi:hypothetical protein I302_101398 [Kwoniella bestiolae CBS 10118]|uniref:Uncharacterized protein n=1 Tax=Kwoniella bestiolae CBS 10118 TaxID=1296100 RepID=A0A1B9GC43_9TREE|nr:hypothetical protein I302_00080 [Kwoniella bestiolae CBS 10118]OCF28592.1 hypothetical protein I302_00080 [Kwoniella bestiolae CBS 10118]